MIKIIPSLTQKDEDSVLEKKNNSHQTQQAEADTRRIFPRHPSIPSCLVRLSSYAQRAKSLQFLVHRELIKQAISFMIAFNGPEKNGAWEGGDRMSGVVVFGRWMDDEERKGCWEEESRGAG